VAAWLPGIAFVIPFVCGAPLLALPGQRAAQDPLPISPSQEPAPRSEEEGDGQGSNAPVGPPAPAEPGAAPVENGPVTLAAPAPESKARASLPELQPAYRSLEDVNDLVGRMAEAVPELARAFELGSGTSVPDSSPSGSALLALEFGASGPVLLAERPTVFLFGGLDGVSLSGGEAVLWIASQLLARPERLPADVAFVALPWASPQALSRAASSVFADGRNSRPVDDDRDGKLDEDGPDDVDLDGLVLSMLIEDPAGAWARGEDARFLVPARAGDAPRYVLTSEGRDDDGDGRFNEDGPGGVVLDLNFPVNRRGTPSDGRGGPLPMSEPLARACAELVLSRRAAAVLLLQGNHGSLAAPGGVAADPGLARAAPAERAVLERVTRAFAECTGRDQRALLTLREARGGDRPGAALDWFYAVPGALSFELAPWGPSVETGGEVAVRDARFTHVADARGDGNGDGNSLNGNGPRNGNGRSGAGKALQARPALEEGDRAWASWLDNTRGGLGFVEWHPVELGGGVQALVGGWEPRTIDNPPPEALASALHGLPEFVATLAAGLPRLEVRVLEASREGEVCRVRARVKNLGQLPTGLGPPRPGRDGGGLELELVLPPGAQLVAGESRRGCGRLFGAELSSEAAWIVIAPPGSSLRLRASADWALPVEREVVP